MDFLGLKNYLTDVRQGRAIAPLRACYVLSGDDAYLIREAVGMFRKLLDADYADFNYAEMSVSDGADALVSALNTLPMFDDRRVVVVPDFGGTFDRAALKKYLESPNPAAVLVLVCENGTEKLGDNAEAVSCNRLDGAGLADYVAELLRKPPARTMDGAAQRELFLRTMRFMSRIVCEVEKLKAYSDGAITVDDVRLLVAEETEMQMYKLSDAVGAGDTGRALEVLDRLLKKSEDSVDLVNMLYKYYRRLLHISLHKDDTDAALAAAFGVNPWAVTLGRRTVGRYTPVRLKKCVDSLHGMQYDILTGKRGKDAALHEAVLTLFTL